MTQPLTLVVLAAGKGSRFGGNKQFAGFGSRNIPLMTLNALAAYRAGIRRLVFVISPGTQAQFEQQACAHLPDDMHVAFAIQTNDNLPPQLANSDLSQRSKPLGTAHALWCCHALVDGPLVLTNADDYYGEQAFVQTVQHFNQRPNHWSLVAYPLCNTMSAHGGVNRGLCQLTSNNKLVGIEECLDITKQHNHYQGQVNKNMQRLEATQPVSMNCWGLTPDIFELLAQAIINFMPLANNDTNECMLPDVIMHQLKHQQTINVYHSQSQWYGLTYAQDKPLINEAIEQILQANGVD